MRKRLSEVAWNELLRANGWIPLIYNGVGYGWQHSKTRKLLNWDAARVEMCKNMPVAEVFDLEPRYSVV